MANLMQVVGSRVSASVVACARVRGLMPTPAVCDLTTSGTVVNNTNNNPVSMANGTVSLLAIGAWKTSLKCENLHC